jgi:solute carrier family 25 carnitine/acylcarnitine transporter 20/29
LLRSRHVFGSAPLAVAFLGGVVGGIMRGCLETPAELIKTRLQIGTPWHMSVLLRGLYSTCLRNGCVIGLYWVLFEATKSTREAMLPPVASSY